MIYYLLIFLIIIIICVCLNTKTGSAEEIEYLDIKFPIEKNIKVKVCPKSHIHLPDFCAEIDRYSGAELPDYPEKIKSQLTPEFFRQEFSTAMIPFSAILGYFYLVAEVLATKLYKEIIIIGSYTGVIPLALAEIFNCKIYYFTIKPVLKELKDNKFVKVFHRFPNENDFAEFQGLPLFNLMLIVGLKKELDDLVNAQYYTFSYANYILKSFRPIFSRTVLYGFWTGAKQSQLLPEGKFIVIPWVYFMGGFYALETEGNILRDRIYDFDDVRKRLFIFNHCARTLNYDAIRVSTIPEYSKLKKIADKYIGKMIDFGYDLSRETFLQKNSCYQKILANNTGKFIIVTNSEKDFKYSYVDGIWHNMPKMNFLSFGLAQEAWTVALFLNFKKEVLKIKSGSIVINVYDKYKRIFVTNPFGLKNEYAYLIRNESELYFTIRAINKIHFYLPTKIAKNIELIKRRNYIVCETETEFRKMAAKNNQTIIEPDFYRPEFIEPCAVMLQTIWGTNPYPYRCFIPDSRLLRDIIAVTFSDAVIYIISDNPIFDSMRQTVRIKKIEDFIESGDYLFTE